MSTPVVGGARAPVHDVHHRHRHPERAPHRRGGGRAAARAARAAAFAQASDTARIAFAPRFALLSVPSRSRIVASIRALIGRVHPRERGAGSAPRRSPPPAGRRARGSAPDRRRAAPAPRARPVEGAGGDRSPADEAAVEDDVRLDGGVAARVDDLAGDDVSNDRQSRCPPPGICAMEPFGKIESPCSGMIMNQWIGSYSGEAARDVPDPRDRLPTRRAGTRRLS